MSAQLIEEQNEPEASAQAQLRGATVWALVAHAIVGLPASVLVATVAMNVLALILPLAMMQVYDRVLANRSYDTLAVILGFLVAAAIAEAVIRDARNHLVLWRAAQLTYRVRDEAIGRILAAPTRWLHVESATKLRERLNGLLNVAEWHGGQSQLVLLDLPFVLVFVALMAYVGGLLVFVPIALVCFMLSAGIGSDREVLSANARRTEADMQIRDFLSEVFRSIGTIKASAMETQMLRRFELLQQKKGKASFQALMAEESASSRLEILSMATQIAVITVGASMVMNGHLSLGTLTCCTMLAGRVVQPLVRCVSLWGEIRSHFVNWGKAGRILELAPPLAAPELNAAPERKIASGIHFEQVVFGYSGVPAILRGANLRIAAGASVAMMGPDGTGKSSLCRLLMGQVTPQSGQVLFTTGGSAVMSAEPVGPVIHLTADSHPLQGTILENLSAFRGWQYEQAARAAARLIGLEDDIHALPLGYETLIGDEGSSELPKGFLQRLAIASALARNPSILILDECNLAIEYKAEQRVISGLQQLQGQMTLLVITNQPSFAAFTAGRISIRNGQFVNLDRERVGHMAERAG